MLRASRFQRRQIDVKVRGHHNACISHSLKASNMSTLQIRNLPDDVREALSLRAEIFHRSLAQQAVIELKQMTEIKAGEQRRAVLNKIRHDLTKGHHKLEPAPEVMIREDRDR